MSGGTWEYRDKMMVFLAEDIRDLPERYRGDWGEDLSDDLPRAREAVAELLVLVAALVKDLDWHFADDGHIENESEWMATAWERIVELKGRFVDG